ncbi:RagB/SusD family nutrient uptake outer membrane protein [Pseudoflavitalea rhizosphaerae]|uniref:RagB/SusD family nutrient uptake outer membrane protein n=1 Tax=Pseudoflavitalea rhizosphaerae TaxID=1884793 RepID=UPI000F8F5D57|nr:RagB/SusD family nutrient uptake outer membrane protein [Pseudoflavitalea rhizosphaerae]
MTKTIYHILLATLATGSVSCNKFLDEKPYYALTDDNAITSLSKARAAIGGVYATFQGDNWAGSTYIAQASKSGFVKWVVSDYDMAYTQLSRTSAEPWTSFYKSLNAANFAVNGIDALSSSIISDDEKKMLVAEGRCLRAWVHSNILWNYCHWWADDADEYGLLYRDEVINLKNIQKARISVGESYQKIFEDLDFAIANLPAFKSSRYVSKEFAQVLKAKLLLYRGGYRNNATELNQSLALVNDVLQNHAAAFTMEADLAEVYKQSWDSKECLFARYLENDGTRTNKGGYYYTYYLSQIAGTTLPLAPNATLTAGLNFGLDWFLQDPRWPVVTGPVRAGETWDNTYRHTFKKVARYGAIEGKTVNDEKYAAYYFRFPELYLMKAELIARTGGSVNDALAPLNEMRSKRTNPVLPPLSAATMDDFMNLLFREIFTENFIENGSEFFASLRFNSQGKRWIEVIKDKTLEENKICWPIPDAEATNNKLMKQNPDM